MRIFFATVMVMIIFSTAWCQTSPKISHVSETTLSKSETRDLLKNFNNELLLSSRGNGPMWPLLILKKERPVKELESLYIDRDQAVLGLGGTFYGIICRYVAPRHFCNLFLHELSDSDPKIRMFACNALGEIGEANAISSLKKLLNDDAIVPGYSDGRVSIAAAFALSWLGNSDGFPVMFDYAQRNPSHWKYNVLGQFRRFSNKDYGNSLEAWRKHFKTNPPQLQDNSYRWSQMAGEGFKISDTLILLKRILILNNK